MHYEQTIIQKCFAIPESKYTFCNLRPALTKWATSCQGTKGDMALWTFQKSIETKEFYKEIIVFGPQIK